MITRHFLKTLVVFIAMIALGLIGLFVVSYLGKNDNQPKGNGANALKGYEYLEEVAN